MKKLSVQKLTLCGVMAALGLTRRFHSIVK